MKNNIFVFYIYLKLVYTYHVATSHASSLLRNNKLYIYEPIEYDKQNATVTVYNLKDGPISQLESKTVVMKDIPKADTPQFLNLPRVLESEVSNQIWMIGGQNILYKGEDNTVDSMWFGQFVNTPDIRYDTSFIEKPEFEHFPVGGFSQDIVYINNNPTLYIIGGFYYSSDKKTKILTSGVFTYDFSSNSWHDLSESANSILPPIADHKSVVVDNFILVTGGLSPSFTNTQYPRNSVYNNTSVALNYFDKGYKYDLLSQKWSQITIKTNLNESLYRSGDTMSHMQGASLKLYKGTLVTYTLLYNLNTESFDPRLAVLDYNKWEWNWYEVKTESGGENDLQLGFSQSVVIKDQLILIHGEIKEVYSDKLYAINLKDRKFQSMLNLSGSNGTSSGIPTYAIVIIVLGIIVIFLSIGIVYYRFRYKKGFKTSKHKGQLQEVWNSRYKELDDTKIVVKNSRISYDEICLNDVKK